MIPFILIQQRNEYILESQEDPIINIAANFLKFGYAIIYHADGINAELLTGKTK